MGCAELADSFDVLDQNSVFDGYTDKQRRILNAAIDVFAEKGYANSSTHEIAKRAGAAEGNIFSKFGNKQGLLSAIINPVVQFVFPAMVREFASTQLTREYDSLHSFISSIIMNRMVLLRVNTNAKVLKIFLSEVVYSQNVREQVIANVPSQYWQVMDAELDNLKQRGLMVNWDNHEIMRLLLIMAGGTLGSVLLFKQDLAGDAAQHLIEAITKALTP
jgi:AcrR family transcriptional regulator